MKEILRHACLALSHSLACVPRPLMQDPVITPDGHLFSREAILENLLSQVCERFAHACAID